MNSFSIDFNTILAGCSAIVCLASAYKVLKGPIDNYKRKMDVYDKALENLQELGDIVKEMKDDLNTTNDMVYQVLDHLATNNNTGGMAEALNEYNKYFRDKK